jgi:hypothetical protein
VFNQFTYRDKKVVGVFVRFFVRRATITNLELPQSLRPFSAWQKRWCNVHVVLTKFCAMLGTRRAADVGALSEHALCLPLFD